MKYHIVAQAVFPDYTEDVCSYCFTKVIQMNAVKDEDMLRKAIRKFVQDGSPQNLKDALKNLQKDNTIKNLQSTYKQLIKKWSTEFFDYYVGWLIPIILSKQISLNTVLWYSGWPSIR